MRRLLYNFMYWWFSC